MVRKEFIIRMVLGLLAACYMAAIGTPAYGKEAPSYGEETPAYGEESPGYGEEAPAYKEETPGYAEEATSSTVTPIEKPAFQDPVNKPRSIHELIMWYDSSGCKECHEEIYLAWEKSHHARPLMGIGDLVFLRPVLKGAPLAVRDPQDATRKNFPCFKCHLPQAMNAADPVFPQIARAILANDKKTLRQLNISCLVCHNEVAITHKLLYGRPEAGVVYGTQDIDEHENENFPKVKKSVIMKRSVMCGQCHGLGPNLEFENPVQCATLFGSYMHAYIPAGGHKTCQECHMENGDHSFPPDFNRKKETSARLSKSIRLDVETLGYQFLTPEKEYVPVAAVNTRVINEAGHRIPDG